MIIVTGGAGFIGSNIAARLAADGREVVVVDHFGEAGLGKWRNLRAVDVADYITPENLIAFLDKAWRNIDGLVHMGAISSTTETDVDLVMETNFRLSRDLWDWCVARQRPLVYASSAATYGDGALGFVDSNARADLLALKPLNAYGWSKKAFDLFATRRAAEGQAPPRWNGLKFFNVYGPNEGHKGAQKSVVAHIYPVASKGEPVRLFKSHHPDYADGGQLRDFIYVRDCVDVVAWLIDEQIQGGVLNVGTGKARTFADLAGALFKALGKKPAITYADTPVEIRDKYQYFTQADTTRLRALGYERQFTTIESGVADYVAADLSRVE
jgi:ADP-L-glycero-D-manno-heptose 6-epimerase